jgi:HD-like signal output (HDOD) protein
VIKVCIEHLTAGMVLAREVKGLDNSVLFPKGTALGGGQIETLSTMGQGYVFIKPPGSPREISELLERCVREHTRKFFLYVNPDSPVFEELFRISVLRTLTASRQGWTLPCENELYARDVESMSDLFHRDMGTPKDIVDHETGLVSFPDIYFRIKEVLETPSSSADDIARVVSTDLGLSAKLLKLVNSPFYGLATSVDSVVRGVALIGVKELSLLALGISTINFFKDIPPELMDMRTFWRHSLRCALFAKLLSSRIPGTQPERFFTAGLLHDCGRLIVFKNMPYASVESMLFARRGMVPQVEAEREVLGYDHTEVSELLLRSWQFPPHLIEMIAHHHSPMTASVPRDAAVVQLADNLANAAEIAEGGMYVLPGMDDGAWELFGMDVGALKGVMEMHDNHFEEIMAAFL